MDQNDLTSAIRQLEYKQASAWLDLKKEGQKIADNLTPVNLVNSMLQEITKAPDHENGLLDTGMSLASGYISKKIVFGSTHNPIKKILGGLLQVGVSNMVSKNTGILKAAARFLLERFQSKSGRPQ